MSPSSTLFHVTKLNPTYKNTRHLQTTVHLSTTLQTSSAVANNHNKITHCATVIYPYHRLAHHQPHNFALPSSTTSVTTPSYQSPKSGQNLYRKVTFMLPPPSVTISNICSLGFHDFLCMIIFLNIWSVSFIKRICFGEEKIGTVRWEPRENLRDFVLLRGCLCSTKQ